MRCGLLGEKLAHSYSPAIHRRLGNYEYRLIEKAPSELETFLNSDTFDALNVTIPYKKAVMPYCAALSDTARRIGSVNTIVRRGDGTLYGDNTDAYGFSCMIKSSGIRVEGAKALVLGSGGACATVTAVLREMGAREIVIISRGGEDNYDNLSRHADAELIVNTTPVGMYPNCIASPLDLAQFPLCRGVLDLIYNPRRTGLILQAESLGIPCESGLVMLVAQAKRAAELFTGRGMDDAVIGRIVGDLRAEMENIVLVGMPGSGKSTIAAALGELTGRRVLDSDEEIVRRAGKSIPELFAESGEESFRELESAVLRELGKASGLIIATGGGAMLREENYAALHQNGTIIHLRRALSELPIAGRPLSQTKGVEELWNARRERYERFADHVVDNNAAAQSVAEAILEVLR
ncbi:MAG: shikimate kinase [Oscillospiraceae bacterium]|nr:shikimate kinase [Oscillospiraceae bacterium]